jgi:hypothetical protein
MNVELLAALARLRVNEMLAGAALRRALLRDRKPTMAARVRIASAIRAFGKAAITLGDAVATRVL